MICHIDLFYKIFNGFHRPGSLLSAGLENPRIEELARIGNGVRVGIPAIVVRQLAGF